MGTWTTKFRKPALIAGLLAISIAVNTAFAREPSDDGSKRGGAGFRQRRHHRRRGRRTARRGRRRDRWARVMGERSHKKSEALAARKAEAALLASEVETLNSRWARIEAKAGEVGSTVQFRTGADRGSRQ